MQRHINAETFARCVKCMLEKFILSVFISVMEEESLLYTWPTASRCVNYNKLSYDYRKRTLISLNGSARFFPTQPSAKCKQSLCNFFRRILQQNGFGFEWIASLCQNIAEDSAIRWNDFIELCLGKQQMCILQAKIQFHAT